MAGTPQATHLSYLGVTLDKYRSLLTASAAASATSVTVANATSWPASGNITIYDPTSGGTTTETVAYSAVNTGTGVVTCSALANAHSAGLLVVVTAAADAPTAYIPVKKFEPYDNLMLLDDTGYRGSEVTTYGVVAGVEHGEYGTEGDVFADTFPWFLGALFGDYTTSGSGPYTHTFAIKNSTSTSYGGGQPESLTLADFNSLTTGGKARAYPGMLVHDLTINFNSEGLLSYTVKMTGYPSGAITKPTSSWGALTPIAVWQGTVTIGGTNVLYVNSGDISIKRAVKVLHTVDGAQVPYSVWLGPIEVSGKMTFVASDETELLRYLNNTQPATVFNWTVGAGASLTQLQITSTKTAYKNTKVTRGTENAMIDTDLAMQANTTDVGASGGYSPVKIVVQNGQNGSTTPYQ